MKKWIHTGIQFLDDALLGLDNRDFLLFGAYSGVGKTLAAVNIALNAARAGHRVLFFALEAHINEVTDRATYFELCKRWFEKFPHGKFGINLRYRAWRKGLLDDEFSQFRAEADAKIAIDMQRIEVVYRKKTLTVDDFTTAISLLENDFVILDHIHFLDYDDTNDIRALRQITKKIQEKIQEAHKPVLCIAHLRKADRKLGGLPEMDDFYGSSDLFKIATEVVLMANSTQKSSSGHPTNWFYFPKSRTAGETRGFVGLHSYDVTTSNYSTKYKLYRLKKFEEPEEVRYEDFPRWAVNATITEEGKKWATNYMRGKDE